jgi:hypothetical protein
MQELAMNGRFEVLTLSDAQCLVRFRDSNDRVLIASSTVPDFELAERTIEWLRSSLQKDWLYQIGRAFQGNGPMFTLAAPFGVVCSSPGFSSSDAMERAVAYIKDAAVVAPVVIFSGNRESRVASTAPGHPPAARIQAVSALAGNTLQKAPRPVHVEPVTARLGTRDL